MGAPYTFTVAETESVGQTVYTEVKVTDADEGQNSEIQLFCDAEKQLAVCHRGLGITLLNQTRAIPVLQEATASGRGGCSGAVSGPCPTHTCWSQDLF